MPRSATKLTSSSIRSEINVTPLVDVCLVLLIIFMVVTPLLTPDPGVRLPETRAPQPLPEDAGQLAVSIRADGGVRLGGGHIADARLAAELGAIHRRCPDREVVVKADRSLPYHRVREVMRMLNEAGFTRVGLVTERSDRQSV
jgi:biopolymer transport protein TolR